MKSEEQLVSSTVEQPPSIRNLPWERHRRFRTKGRIYPIQKL